MTHPHDECGCDILLTVKALVTFALLALLAVTGRAAPINVLLITLADQVVDFSLNIGGLGDSTATLFLFSLDDDPYAIDNYYYFVKNAKSPVTVPEENGVTDGLTSYRKYLVAAELASLNNTFYELFIDADNYMIGRFGESPDFALTFDHFGEADDEDVSFYNLTASIVYQKGYIAPFHSGPDSIPEPTSGLLLLVGSAMLLIRRRTR